MGPNVNDYFRPLRCWMRWADSSAGADGWPIQALWLGLSGDAFARTLGHAFAIEALLPLRAKSLRYLLLLSATSFVSVRRPARRPLSWLWNASAAILDFAFTGMWLCPSMFTFSFPSRSGRRSMSRSNR
jgi:hypothetical protein